MGCQCVVSVLQVGSYSICGMKVVFNRTWARAYWSRADRVSPSGRVSRASLADAVCLGSGGLSTLPDEFSDFPLPANVLLGDVSKRYKDSNSAISTSCHPLTIGSIIYVRDGFYVVSPEMLFLEYARKLSLLELIAFGYELCGTYSTNPFNRKTLFDLPLVTSRSKIEQYLKRVLRGHGLSKALNAIRYVQDGSASPMETALHMHFCLPGQLGGFGLPVASLNYEIALSSGAQRLYRRKSCRCDLYFPSIRHCVEYNGSFHDLQKEDDFNRAAALEIMRIKTTIVTYSQYNNLRALAEVALKLSSELGVPLRNHQQEPGLRRFQLHAALRSYLFYCRDAFLC